jgi:hypothetical protein
MTERRKLAIAEAQLQAAVEELWLAGIEAGELVARVRAIVDEYAANTERYSPARRPPADGASYSVVSGPVPGPCIP